MATIQLITNAAFNGTTTKDSLYGSIDNGATWIFVQTMNPTSGGSTVVAILNPSNYGWYKVVHTKGNASAGTITGTVLQKNGLINPFIPHFYATFQVTGNDTINGSSPGVVIPISARYKWELCAQSVSTLTATEEEGFTLSNDTITYTYLDGHLVLSASISLAMATNEDYEFRWYNVTQSTPIGTPKAVSSSLITNITNCYIYGYDINANTGDKYVLQIRNLKSARDPFMYYLDTFLRVCTQ